MKFGFVGITALVRRNFLVWFHKGNRVRVLNPLVSNLECFYHDRPR